LRRQDRQRIFSLEKAATGSELSEYHMEAGGPTCRGGKAFAAAVKLARSGSETNFFERQLQAS